MNVLLVGSGGREHAIASRIKRSRLLTKLWIAPGNAGTAELGENVDIAAKDVDRLIAFAKENKIDLIVVGPDLPLMLGIVDKARAADILAFGPTQDAAQIEGSKRFAKQMMRFASVPTAPFTTATDYHEALREVRAHFRHAMRMPLVLKADGLALGKGVYICHSEAEGERALDELMVRCIHGDAGKVVLIEKFIVGGEVSLQGFSDGKTSRLAPFALRDHKPIGDGNKGPNTGGMGTFAPVPGITPDDLAHFDADIVRPILAQLRKLSKPFAGLLYPGLKVIPGAPKTAMVLEINARFGDTEAQTLLRLLKSDLLELLLACAQGRLDQIKLEWRDDFAVCVVLAADGYPGTPRTGDEITGIEEARQIAGVEVFHAGTAMKDGKLVTNGGRVLNVTALGSTLKAAVEWAYYAVNKIHFEGMQYRTDIGKDFISS